MSPDKNKIVFLFSIAEVLMNKKVEGTVAVAIADGPRMLKIEQIEYL